MARRPCLSGLILALAACAPSTTPRPGPAPGTPEPATLGVANAEIAGAGTLGRGAFAPQVMAPPPDTGQGGAGGGDGGSGGGPVDPDVKIRFTEKFPLPLAEGAYHLVPGVAVFDYDEDGDLDVFVPMQDVQSFLWRNDGGFHFVRLDTDAGIPSDIQGLASVLGDCDGDGHLDLVVLGKERLAMLRNVGGRFEEVQDAGLITTFGPGGSVFFDADGDGDLDLFVTCYWDVNQCRDGHRVFLNDGTCHFTDDTAGRFPYATRRAHASAAFDFDEDGDTDILVASDLGNSFEPDLVLQNDGTGHFTDVAADLNLRHKAFSMSAEVADIDGDGRLDVYMGNICRNPLALNQGPGKPYVEADVALGVSADWYIDHDEAPLILGVLDPDDPLNRAELEFRNSYATNRPDDDQSFCLTSWSTEAADLDADGQRELLVVNGAVGQPMEGLRQPNLLYWQKPGETRFREIGRDAGLRRRGWGRTGMFADLDGDGRLDLLVGNRQRSWIEDAPGEVYRNLTPFASMGHHLFVDLRGPGANVSGIGAVVEITAGGRKQIAYRTFAGSFLTSSSAPLHFGLGSSTVVDEIVVRWPWGGGVDRFTAIEADKTITLTHGSGR